MSNKFIEDHNRLLPTIDSLLGDLTNRVNTQQISVEDGFYILAKTLKYWTENVYADREEYLKDITDTFGMVSKNVLPSLPDQDENFMLPKLMLLASNLVEYVNYTKNIVPMEAPNDSND